MEAGSSDCGRGASSLMSEASTSGSCAFASSSDEELEDIDCGLAGADLRRDTAVELLCFSDTGRGGLKAGVLRLAEGFARSISRIVIKTFATGYFSIAIVEKNVVGRWANFR